MITIYPTINALLLLLTLLPMILLLTLLLMILRKIILLLIVSMKICRKKISPCTQDVEPVNTKLSILQVDGKCKHVFFARGGGVWSKMEQKNRIFWLKKKSKEKRMKKKGSKNSRIGNSRRHKPALSENVFQKI